MLAGQFAENPALTFGLGAHRARATHESRRARESAKGNWLAGW